jgi:glycosyltransferase involved in cell wall biosynthesis
MSQKIKPMVSICIPVFNGENFLANCINSILEQDYDNFEILIVDNCSTDSTRSIIVSYEDNRIRYIKNEFNIGSLKNFSKCIENAIGDYFVLLPHDDILLPGCITEFASRLDDPSTGIVFGAVSVINQHGDLLTTRLDHPIDRLLTHEESLFNLVDNFMPIQLAMVRTSILRKLGGFSTQFSLFSDCHLWFRVALEGWKSFYCAEAFSSHRVHDNQGQNAFLTQDLVVVSEHMGKEIDEDFWKEHNYSYLFFKLSKWLLDEMISRKFDLKIVNNVKKGLLKELSSAHMVSIYRSIILRSKFMFWQEIKLFNLLINSHGFFFVCATYSKTFVFLLKRKLLISIT